MSKRYEPEFRKIVGIHLEEWRTLKSLSDEHCVSKANISIGVNRFRKEFCKQKLISTVRENLWNDRHTIAESYRISGNIFQTADIFPEHRHSYYGIVPLKIDLNIIFSGTSAGACGKSEFKKYQCRTERIYGFNSQNKFHCRIYLGN